jgi:hypothetical protein
MRMRWKELLATPFQSIAGREGMPNTLKVDVDASRPQARRVKAAPQSRTLSAIVRAAIQTNKAIREFVDAAELSATNASGESCFNADPENREARHTQKIKSFACTFAAAGLLFCGVAEAQSPSVDWSDPTTQILASTYQPIYVANWQNGIDKAIGVQANPLDVSVVADPVVSGRNALRVSISRDESFANVANGTPRAELLLPAPVKFAQGRDYLVRWSTFLPLDFEFDSKQLAIITQIHQSSTAGSPTIALTILGTQYVVSQRGGLNPSAVSGAISICCADVDKGKWVNWALRYVPDETGTHSSLELYKDGRSVYAMQGVPNAYLNDQSAYLKIGLYKSAWLTQPSDVNQITMFFGPVYVSQR